MKAAIALGANLGNPAETFERALGEIAARLGAVLIRSHWYRSAPLTLAGVEPEAVSQPNYLNGVVLIETGLAAEPLLAALLEIERSLGRCRESENVRWGARLIDLDLILLEDQIVEAPGLSLPHPEMHRRDFVLVPLMEVWPEWRHPKLEKGIAELIAALNEPTIIERV